MAAAKEFNLISSNVSQSSRIAEQNASKELATLSGQLRAEGNKIYVSSGDAVAPVLRKYRLEQAISKYNQALQSAQSEEDEVSALKNIGVTNSRLANVIYSTASSPPSAEDMKRICFSFKEAIQHFSRSYNFARDTHCKTVEWQGSLMQSFHKCLEDALDPLDAVPFSEKAALYEEYIYLIGVKCIRAEFCLQIGQLYFHQALRALIEDDFRNCLRHLHDCYRPVEEAEKAGQSQPWILREVEVLRLDVKLQTCTAESVQARTIGDKLYEDYVSCKGSEESLSLSMVYEILDWYRQAVILTREVDVEMEAIALSRIGRLYAKALQLKSRARENFTKAIQLALSLHPRSFTSEEWYKECTETLDKYQQEQVKHESDKWQEGRKQFIDELKDELKELEEKSALDGVEFLKFLYEKYPPKNKTHQLPKELPDVTDGYPKFNNALKAVFRNAVVHYHPDRCDLKVDGKKWKVFSEEVTKLLTGKYEVLK